ncbi:pentapeptide repeat-containing protein [Hamadaea tsunoensis]|uniref:pentapeptide repeat-containing protein n=1 Tax=Hamadaea tsunoensis TaxID=53368 RepID=UPI003899246E
MAPSSRQSPHRFPCRISSGAAAVPGCRYPALLPRTSVGKLHSGGDHRERPDIGRIHHGRVPLGRVHLRRVHLRHVRLRHAHLRTARLRRVRLRHAHLRHVRLRHVRLGRARR